MVLDNSGFVLRELGWPEEAQAMGEEAVEMLSGRSAPTIRGSPMPSTTSLACTKPAVTIAASERLFERAREILERAGSAPITWTSLG